MSIPHHSKWTGFKEYISQREVRRSLPSGEEKHVSTHTIIQGWSHWAGQKIRRHSTDVATVDEVHLVPGWAIKRPHRPAPSEPDADNAFDLEFNISGFATSRRTPELLTRSQRAFLKIARGFASIPKFQPGMRPLDTELQPQYPSELLHLPPRPCEISDDYDVETLEAHFRDSGNQEVEDIHFAPQPGDSVPAELARLHENIKSRLKLFWASSLPSRRVQLSIFLQSSDPRYHLHSQRPLLTQEMLTGPDGHFSDAFVVHWEKIYTRLVGTHITSDQTHAELELLVEARIVNTESAPELHETPTSAIQIPITHSSIRVISDIDDTVKVSRVTDGARAIFNQVFVRDLEDTVIPEMGEWYNAMWKCGISFHYVSNGPFELLPVINQFIGISKLPRGSIRLRSYAGRSLFNGILSAPATRKKGNVVEVLDQFPDSQFLLVGDSGEQDLELYSSLAAERPTQIVGVFIRDVYTVGLEDPTGTVANVGAPTKLKSRGTMPLPSGLSRIPPKRAASDVDVSTPYPGTIRVPQPIRKGSLPSTSHSFEASPELKLLSRLSEDSLSSVTSSASSTSSSSPSQRVARPLTEGEKRRLDLQNRVNKARSMMPAQVALRVFEDPKECAEAAQIIQRLGGISWP